MGVIWSVLWIFAMYLFPFYFFYSIQGEYVHMVNNTNISWTIDWIDEPSTQMFHSFFETEVSENASFVCSFQCVSNPCEETFLFGIFALQRQVILGALWNPYRRLVWSFNRNKPVRNKATLLLTRDGEMMLREFDGTLVWFTNTKGKSVAGLKLTESGNLVLFDTNNSSVWQSFDHPTDTLLLGQKLYSNSAQQLTASASSTNWTDGGLYSLSLTNDGLFALLESDPAIVYTECSEDFQGGNRTEPLYATLSNGSFVVLREGSNTIQWGAPFELFQATPLQHVTLEFDGRFRVYEFVENSWQGVADIFQMSNCSYPLICGRNEICFDTGEDGKAVCSCPRPDNPKVDYFRQTIDRRSNLGCSEINSLSCDKIIFQKMVELKNIEHLKGVPHSKNTDVESCKLGCLKNCSCKAAMFDLSKNCYLAPQIFSLENVESDRGSDIGNLSFFLKVLDDSSSVIPPLVPASTNSRRNTRRRVIIMAWSFGVFSGLLLIIGIIYFVFLRKQKDGDELEEDYLDQLPGIPKRYSYEDLIAATDHFRKKLGKGGFGSVFEGTLSNGTIVAVKCLEGFGRMKESFLSEVKTIGSIHHVNLVRLLGYTTNKSHRLLVYEFMCNGSLDKWIFNQNQGSALDWQIRRTIILDIAKGLAYLHEECMQKIVHLDIKPQNILLDENFRAKLSDFGLSKLIDKDQSQVVTRMKGTPGYLAPEWLSSVITEKVDVYSFGIVVLEILCGRRNLDRSQLEEDMHLLSVFKRKAEEGQLLDMIDQSSKDMISDGTEVMQMMKVAAWCLQGDFSRRPSMSVVVKVLEGLVEVEENLEYDFLVPVVPRANVIPQPNNGAIGVATPLLPSTLSGPR